jgi:hypothetical protein
MRFCEAPNCFRPVFGTDKKTRTGYCKSHQYLRTDIDKDGIVARAIKKQRKNSAERTGRALRVLAVTDDGNREMAEKHKTKSELLREADRLFSQFIRNRDADKNGNIACVCCGKIYNLEQVDKEGKKIVQPLHFIDRGVYSLRFDEDNCHAGCSYCNLDMFLNKNGFAYRRYLEFMNMTYGEEMVTEMALAHRRINKITEQQLKTVIEYYSQLK